MQPTPLQVCCRHCTSTQFFIYLYFHFFFVYVLVFTFNFSCIYIYSVFLQIVYFSQKILLIISKKLVSPVSCFQCGYVADLRRYQLLKKVSRQVQNYMEPKAVVGPALKVVFSFVVSKIQLGSASTLGWSK